jgi:hypothetical protein
MNFVTLFKFLIGFLICLLTYRFGFIEGAEQNYFDRELAQIKIDQCFEAIGKR